MLSKSQLKGLFSKYDFKPLKRLGQNYLIDANIKCKIITEIDPRPGDTILEIGPGLGALTMDLAQSGANVIAVEKDAKALGALREIASGAFKNLKLIPGDILEFDISSLAEGKKIKIAGNLPYYITSPIIEALIESVRSISSAVILVQKEFAQRLLAGPGSKDYSSFSCFVQYFTKPKYIYTVKRTSFYPEPEVDSAIMRLDMLEKPSCDVSNEALFFRIVRGSFNQRRKSIINSLSRKEVLDVPKSDLAAILKQAKIDPAARPETLSLTDFASIANSL